MTIAHVWKKRVELRGRCLQSSARTALSRGGVALACASGTAPRVHAVANGLGDEQALGMTVADGLGAWSRLTAHGRGGDRRCTQTRGCVLAQTMAPTVQLKLQGAACVCPRPRHLWQWRAVARESAGWLQRELCIRPQAMIDEQRAKARRVWTAPNVICILRMAATPAVCIRTYVHTYIFMHACMHTYIHTYIHTCMHAYIHTYIHTYKQCVSVCVLVHAIVTAYTHRLVLYTHTHHNA